MRTSDEPGRDGLLDHVLDGGLVDDRQHLLGSGLGGRQEPGAETCSRDDSLADPGVRLSHVRTITGAYGRKMSLRLTSFSYEAHTSRICEAPMSQWTCPERHALRRELLAARARLTADDVGGGGRGSRRQPPWICPELAEAADGRRLRLRGARAGDARAAGRAARAGRTRAAAGAAARQRPGLGRVRGRRSAWCARRRGGACWSRTAQRLGPGRRPGGATRCCCPGWPWTGAGMRLGRGGGSYDRVLARLGAAGARPGAGRAAVRRTRWSRGSRRSRTTTPCTPWSPRRESPFAVTARRRTARRSTRAWRAVQGVRRVTASAAACRSCFSTALSAKAQSQQLALGPLVRSGRCSARCTRARRRR